MNWNRKCRMLIQKLIHISQMILLQTELTEKMAKTVQTVEMVRMEKTVKMA